MNKIILVDKEMEPSFVRSQFDEILVREITSLIEIDSDIAMLTYNLSTISTIIIAVEREREIRIDKNRPPQRFTFDSLVNELVALGLYKDDAMLKSVKSVMEQGYLTQVVQGELKAEASAYTIVGFLDKMFPGMQGIQLIAFVMQMIDEVLSERKSLEYAKESFSITLKNSGVAVTREKAEKKAQELALDSSERRHINDIALKLKEANIKRLAQQRLKQKLQLNKEGGKPSFHFDGGSRLDKVRITSIFDHGHSEEEIEAEKKVKDDAERKIKEDAENKAREEAERQYQETLLKAAQVQERERKLREAEDAAREIEKKAAELAAKEHILELAAREQALRDAEMAALRLEQQQAELRAKEAEMVAREAEMKLREEQLKAAAIMEEQLKAASIRNEQLKAIAQQDEIKKAAEEQYKRDLDRTAEIEKEAMSLNYGDTGIRKTISDDDIESKISGISDDIESRIAAFEEELTIPCPVCKNGIIKKEKTQTGKDYFICSDKSCRFVSWSQPYHFPCPLCKNSFLVDFQTSSGSRGLKCPRASCTFSQNNLSDPAIVYNMPFQAVNVPLQPAGYVPPQSGQMPGAGAEPPKKKRLVRRVKR